MLEAVKDWVNSPFDWNMSAPRWFAFFGLLIAISLMWNIVLRHLREV